MTEQLVFDSVVLERAAALWNYNQLTLGLDGIDAQHAWLVCVVMQLEWLLHHDFDQHRDQIEVIGEQVQKYVDEHFKTEELLLNELNYSAAPGHKKGHDKFRLTLERLLSNGSLEEHDTSEKLYRLIRSWLVHHILNEDKDYARYLSSRKLLADAAAVFDRLNSKGPLIDDRRLALLARLRRGARATEVTTPQIIEPIRSTWSRLNLRTGVPLVDIQHLWLIKMIVDMDEALKESHLTRQAVLARTIEEASDYINIHFKTEEKLLELISFDNLENHGKTHKKFTEFVGLRRLNLEKGDLRSALTIVHDLRSWLVNHIALEDRAYVPLCHDNQAAVLAFSKDEIMSGRAGVRQNQINLYKAICGK